MEKPGTILIADDDPGARLILQQLLAREEHGVLMAQNGAEALRLSIEYKPDLVLLDVLMPELDGFEVSRQLCDHLRLREIPILLVTSLGDHQSRVQGLSVGADGFISKPFDMAELLVYVRTITRPSIAGGAGAVSAVDRTFLGRYCHDQCGRSPFVD